ncbi:MAG: ferredoxin reductase family protein [Actinomycetota bacterium]|nr:ferredoxin reductase family protein [Actinomycetota bacterium]
MSLLVRIRGPLLMAALYVVPLLLWWEAVPEANRFPDTPTTLNQVGVLFGFAGISAYAVNVLLGARLKPLSYLFGGVDNMYAAHRLNGRLAFLLIALHGALIIGGRWASADQVTVLFDPGVSWAPLLGVIALLLMALALYLTLYRRLGHETFVYVQRALGLIFVLAAAHVFLTPGAKALSKPLTIYLAVLAAAAMLAFAYRSLFGDVLVRRHDYVVSHVRPLDPQVVEITMSPKGPPLRFTPGQFVYVTFYSDTFNAQFHPFSITAEGTSAIVSVRPGDVRNQFHPFSITSGVGERNLRVAVKAVGDYTTAMRKLDEGAAARAEGPYGSFSYKNVHNNRQIWVAGGIGITPFLSMARSLEPDGHEIDLFFGAKTLQAAYFLEELLALSDTIPGLRVVPFPEDQLGHMNAEYIETTAGGLEDKDVLLCGPPIMIDVLTSQLLGRGVERSKIHFEHFAFGPS